MPENATNSLPVLPDRYEAVEEIGRGGMGVVWSVQDRSLDRRLALKSMLPRAATSAENRARFMREAKITGGLQHPGIPPVVEFGQLTDGVPFFSMKLVEGRTLAAILAEREAPSQNLSHVLGIFEQVCQAVGFAHSRTMIHRDLKPANIMVGAFGEVQVMDWGMAKLTGESREPWERIQRTGHPGHEDTQLNSASTRADNQPKNASVPPGAVTDETIQLSGETKPLEMPVDAETQAFTDRPATPGESPAPESGAMLTQAGSVMGTPAYMPPEQARGEVDRLDPRCDVFSLGAILQEILTGQRLYVGDNLWQQAIKGDLTATFARLDRCPMDVELCELCRSCLSIEPERRPVDATVLAEAIRRYNEEVLQRLQQEQVDRAAAEARTVEEQKRYRLERSKRQITMALAITIVLLIVGGAATAWWVQQDRIARRTAAKILSRQASDDVHYTIMRANELREDNRFPAAETLLSQAERRLTAVADSPRLADEYQRSKADLKVVRRLDEIRLQSATWTNGGFSRELAHGTDGAYATAFQEFGIELFGDETVEALGKEIRESGVAASLIAAIDDWAMADVKNTKRLLAIARAADPDVVLDQLRDPAIWKDRIKLLKLAENADPASLPPATLVSLALRLLAVKEPSAAADVLKQATMQHPDDFWLRFNTAEVLEGFLDQPLEAVEHLQAAIAIRPDNAAAHSQLGLVLQMLGRDDEAEAALRRAIVVDPSHSYALCNLADLLFVSRRPGEAEQIYLRTIEVDPEFVEAHNNLGRLLLNAGRLKEAETSFRRALEIDPNYAMALSNLGELMLDSNRLTEAADLQRRAIQADPKYAAAHYNLGNVLLELGQVEEAEVAYRDAIANDQEFAEAYCNLGNMLLNETDRYAEAAKLLKRGHALGSEKSNWAYPSEQWLKNAELTADLDQKLRAFLVDPSSVDNPVVALNMARFALRKKNQPQASARLYRDFLDGPSVPPEIQFHNQYIAACAAARSWQSCDEAEGTAMRSLALQWLKANLSTWRTGIESVQSAREQAPDELGGWLEDPDLASLRDPDRLAKLPEAERMAWEEFWLEVRQLLQSLDSNVAP